MMESKLPLPAPMVRPFSAVKQAVQLPCGVKLIVEADAILELWPSSPGQDPAGGKCVRYPRFCERVNFAVYHSGGDRPDPDFWRKGE